VFISKISFKYILWTQNSAEHLSGDFFSVDMAVVHVSDTKTWETDVIGSSTPVFVDFWAEWCGPCRMVGPVVEELSGDYNGTVKFVKVNVDEANELASKYNVFSIPTLMIFNNGQVVAQQVGAASKETYKTMIDKALE